MRFALVVAAAAALIVPAGTAPGAGMEGSALQQGWSDASAAKQKKPKKKAAPKEQYLRAVPSTPPPGTKK
jgi:hypothetical protein